MSSYSTDDLVSLFKNIGLDDKKANETVKNKKLSGHLQTAIEESGAKNGVDKSIGSLIYLLASTCHKDNEQALPFIAKAIAKGDLKLDAQVNAALSLAAKRPHFTDVEFNEACGVGIVVSEAQLARVAASVVERHRDEILEDRYACNQGLLLKEMKEEKNMKWAEGKSLKAALDTALEHLLGAKTEEDKLLKPKRKPMAPSLIDTGTSREGSPGYYEGPLSPSRTFEGEVLKFHKPGENKQLNAEIMRKHLEATGGKVVTRFPPEPNGFLHIGHAKAINFNFRYAQMNNGITYLRYDDTNPEAEELKYFVAIRESVEWLGFEPYQVTHSSDYFQNLYEYAIRLIEKGKAYVCHQTPEEIHESRGGDAKGPRTDSPWRNRPVEESLRLFQDMKDGKFKEGEVTLRLKMDMQSSNPFMWDLVAYRVLYTPHVRTGSQWCIYPMYDFTHCLCDSIENITHSLCTTEFILAREAYYWVCDSVEVYKPVQWEYGRLNLTNTVLSKRKLTKLVSEGIVRGWDDPRIYTLAGIRRRGFTPRAVNRFVEKIGITTAFSTVDVKLLESCVREDLNETAPRRMALLDPLLVIIDDLPEDHLEMIELPGQVPCDGDTSQPVPFTRRIYIDRSDFSLNEGDANFFRLTLAQPVGLYRATVIAAMSYRTDSEGRVIEVRAQTVQDKSFKPQTYIQWVADAPTHGSPLVAEVRLYSDLFKSKNPNAAPGGWKSDITDHSLTVIEKAFVDIRLASAKTEEKFQFQRVGYFCVDPDSDAPTDATIDLKSAQPRRLVFNRTVTLREDSTKTN